MMITKKFLGEGRFSKVYEGRENDQSFAVKIFKDFKFNGSFNDLPISVQQEIKIQQPLDHLNIVRLIDWKCIGSNMCIILELLPHGDLGKLIDTINNQLDETRCINIVENIANGLAYLHELTILHRDIKSSNILVGHSGEVKIADFGYAIAFNEINENTKLVGTSEYAAPELYLHHGRRAYTPKSDIYALGIIAFELVKRDVAFERWTRMGTLIDQITSGKREMIPENAPDSLRLIITRCWDQNPEQRPEAKDLVNSISTTKKPIEHEMTSAPMLEKFGIYATPHKLECDPDIHLNDNPSPTTIASEDKNITIDVSGVNTPMLRYK